MQARSGSSQPLPFAIMTSDDTHARTLALLEQHSYFGMSPEQVWGHAVCEHPPTLPPVYWHLGACGLSVKLVHACNFLAEGGPLGLAQSVSIADPPCR